MVPFARLAALTRKARLDGRPPVFSPTMTEPSIIDPQALARLREWGGEKLAAQMVRLFLANTGTRMEQIRSGAGSGDMEEAERGAHSLKSSAANIGAETLRVLVTRLEGHALEEEAEALRALLPEVESAYAEAVRELERIEKDMAE